MTTSERSKVQVLDQLTLLPEGSPASHSVLPGTSEARQMTVTSGRKWLGLLQSADPVTSWVKTLLESSRWNSTLVYLTWKVSATPRGRLLFRLSARTHDTSANEFGLWPTMTVIDSSMSAKGKKGQHRRHSTQLSHLANSGRIHHNDWPEHPSHEGGTADGSVSQALTNAARMLPTPTVQDSANNGGPSQAASSSPPLNSIASGPLNPEWVEWLMGYPVGWTDLED